MASSAAAPSAPYKLYMRRYRGAIFNPDDMQGRIFFVFCRGSKARLAEMQRWNFCGIAYAAWDARAPNPLLREKSDPATGQGGEMALEGFVDAAQVENPTSALRRIVELLPEDMDKHDDEWRKWLRARVQAALKARDGRSEDEVEEELTRKYRDEWQCQFFEVLALDKIEKLRKEKLLWWPEQQRLFALV